eukprot:6555608-Lingulodinium_polyedra.AAC.1
MAGKPNVLLLRCLPQAHGAASWQHPALSSTPEWSVQKRCRSGKLLWKRLSDPAEAGRPMLLAVPKERGTHVHPPPGSASACPFEHT